MKAKFIYEKFDRDKKPVGMSSSEGIDQWIEKWKKKGLRFGWQFFDDDKKESKREFVSRYHQYIDKYLNKLHEVGIPWENMQFWGDHLDVKTWQLLKGNWSLFHCITKEDAELVKNVIQDMTTGGGTIHISEDNDHIDLADQIHYESDPEHRKWTDRRFEKTGEKRRTDLSFLENIEETRKKLKSIK